MRKRLEGLVFGALFVAGLLYGQAVMACTTQTLIVGGKMTVCTICGTVVSCMWGDQWKKFLLYYYFFPQSPWPKRSITGTTRLTIGSIAQTIGRTAPTTGPIVQITLITRQTTLARPMACMTTAAIASVMRCPPHPGSLITLTIAAIAWGINHQVGKRWKPSFSTLMAYCTRLPMAQPYLVNCHYWKKP